MKRARLFDTPGRRRKAPPATTCTDLVPLDPTRCPACGSPTHEHGAAQPALFYFGGYGATTLHTQRRCSSCGWRLSAVDERSLSPRHP